MVGDAEKAERGGSQNGASRANSDQVVVRVATTPLSARVVRVQQSIRSLGMYIQLMYNRLRVLGSFSPEITMANANRSSGALLYIGLFSNLSREFVLYACSSF